MVELHEFLFFLFYESFVGLSVIRNIGGVIIIGFCGICRDGRIIIIIKC